MLILKLNLNSIKNSRLISTWVKSVATKVGKMATAAKVTSNKGSEVLETVVPKGDAAKVAPARRAI